MGDHVDAYEALLRSAFPGETEDFYEYGKGAVEFLIRANMMRSLTKQDKK